jgi:hypothetical protein
MTPEGIERADYAEELAAGMALSLVTNKRELLIIWNRDCDHFQGEQLERLEKIYRRMFTKFAPMARAG